MKRKGRRAIEHGTRLYSKWRRLDTAMSGCVDTRNVASASVLGQSIDAMAMYLRHG